jgi:hypothetical protein
MKSNNEKIAKKKSRNNYGSHIVFDDGKKADAVDSY